MNSYLRLDNKNEQIELTSNVIDDSSESTTQSSNSHNTTQFSLNSSFNTIDLFIINQYATFKESFKSLNTCPKELYVNFFLKFCESYGYFSISQILVIYLHDEFHVSDIQAGAIYGIWGACITFWGLSISWLNDNFGVRNSLLMGFTIQAISSVIIASARSIVTIYIVLFLIMPIGTAMGIPMLTVGIKRYTNNVNRGFAFGLYYSVMNIAAFVSGPVVDLCNIGLKGGITVFGMHWSGNRLVILTTTVTYLTSLVVTYNYLREIRVQQEIAIPVDIFKDRSGVKEVTSGSSSGSTRNNNSNNNDEILRLDDDIDIDIDDVEQNSLYNRKDNHVAIESNYEELNNKINSKERSTIHLLPLTGNTYCTPPSHTTLSDNNKYTNMNDDNSHIEEHLHSGYSRTTTTNNNNNTANNNNYYKNNVTVSSSSTAANNTIEVYEPAAQSLCITCNELIHSTTFWRFTILTLFLINLNTIFRHLDATLPTYLIRCFGANYPKGIIYSINPFMIIWLTPIVSALTTKYAHYDMIKYGGYVTAIAPFFLAMATATWSVVMFTVFLSLGEAIWSPRTYDYTMSVAPEGREASFSALASAPLFAAKIPVGLLSGYLVSKYMAEDNQHPDGQSLWLIIGLVTITSPICITVFEKCVREPTKTSRTSSPETSVDDDYTEEGIEIISPMDSGTSSEYSSILHTSRFSDSDITANNQMKTTNDNKQYNNIKNFSIEQEDDDDDDDDDELVYV